MMTRMVAARNDPDYTECNCEPVIIGTRKSELARRQTDIVRQVLLDAWCPEDCLNREFNELLLSDENLVEETDRKQHEKSRLLAERRKMAIESSRQQAAQQQLGQRPRVYSPENKHYCFVTLGMTTIGDNIQNVALSQIGSKALFTKELEVALAADVVDIVVHSLKDLPTTLPPGMCVAAVLSREDARDAVVLKSPLDAENNRSIQQYYQQRQYNPNDDSMSLLGVLRPGSVIGTSSVRRAAQLKARFPHLVFENIRGNLNTRLSKLDDPNLSYAALILAQAGLTRLGWSRRISEILDPSVCAWAVGQGALAIECAKDNERMMQLVRGLDHLPTRLAISAERALMKKLEGGCSVPIGVTTFWIERDTQKRIFDYRQISFDASAGQSAYVLHLQGIVASKNGETIISSEATADVQADITLAEQLGHDVATSLISKGADDILRSIEKKV